MNKKQLKQITNEHYRLLKKHIRKVAANFDAVAIHQFRVAYKRLRAFLRLINTGENKDRKIKISRKLKEAYGIAGTIRDLQLQQQRIWEATEAEYKRPQDYLDRLQQSIDLLKPAFTGLIPESTVNKCKRKTDAGLPDEFSFHLFREFINQKWASMRRIMAYRQLRDDHIHTIRKHLKDLFYNLKVYDEAEGIILPLGTRNDKNEAYYFQLLDELGRFQDTCIAITFLEKKWVNGLNRYNRTLLSRVKKDRVNEKQQLKKMLVNKLRSGIRGQ